MKTFKAFLLSLWIIGLKVPLFAQEVSPQQAGGGAIFSLHHLLISIVYGLMGIALLIVGYYIFELVTPFSVKKELIEDQNIAIGVVMGAIILGMAIIIAAAII